MDLEKCAGFFGFGKVRWILCLIWIWKSALDFVDLEKCAAFCGFGKVRWILWIWKSALDFVFDMDLEKCAGTANYITTGPF